MNKVKPRYEVLIFEDDLDLRRRYQKQAVIKTKYRAKIIESLLLELPLPTIFALFNPYALVSNANDIIAFFFFNTKL